MTQPQHLEVLVHFLETISARPDIPQLGPSLIPTWPRSHWLEPGRGWKLDAPIPVIDSKKDVVRLVRRCSQDMKGDRFCSAARGFGRFWAVRAFCAWQDAMEIDQVGTHAEPKLDLTA